MHYMELTALRRISSNPHAVVAVVAVVVAAVVVVAVAAGTASPQCAWAAHRTLPTGAFHVVTAVCPMPPALQPVRQATGVNPRLPARRMEPGVQ